MWLDTYEKEFKFNHVRYGKIDSCERFESISLVIAGSAFYGTLILALHQVDYNRLVSLKMKLPVSIRFLLIRTLQIWHFNIFFVSNSVNIFMELI